MQAQRRDERVHVVEEQLAAQPRFVRFWSVLKSGGEVWIPMDEPTRVEFEGWLG